MDALHKVSSQLYTTKKRCSFIKQIIREIIPFFRQKCAQILDLTATIVTARISLALWPVKESMPMFVRGERVVVCIIIHDFLKGA